MGEYRDAKRRAEREDAGKQEGLEDLLDLQREVSRRGFLQQLGIAGMGGLGALSLTGAALAACGSDGGTKKEPGSSSGGGGKIAGLTSDTLKIGFVGIFSGPFSFAARIQNDGIHATVEQINSTGGIGGRKIEVVKRDVGSNIFTEPPKAYQELVGNKDIVGIAWFSVAGLEELRPQIRRDNIPLVALATDPFSKGTLYPKTPERSIFQMLTPEIWSVDLAIQYLKEDRGYKTVSLLYDKVVYTANFIKRYENSLKKYGMTSVGVEEYGFGNSDFGPQLQRLKAKRSDALLFWGISTDTAVGIKAIDAMGSAYVDTPTAKGPGWHPQIIGSPGGTGEKSWAELSKQSAKVGTLTPWHLGGTVHIPDYKLAQYMKKFNIADVPTGGEDLAADAIWALLQGVKKAGSVDRQKVVAAMETMGKQQFATLPFEFTKDDHLGRSEDDRCLATLERGSGPATTDPAYELGKEYKDFFPSGYVGPTHLVRPTLEANRRAHPEAIEKILEEGWGTQCTKKGGKLTKDCKIH